MPNIQWKDIDALCSGVYELLVLTYLQGQVLTEEEVSVFEEDGLKISKTDSATYLWERQRDCLQTLKRLIEKENLLLADNAPEESA